MNSTARRLGGMAIASVTAALLLVAAVAPAAQAADSSLTIRVTTAVGTALTGATVRVIPVDNGRELPGTVSTLEQPAKSGKYVTTGDLESEETYAVEVTTAPTSTSNGYTQFFGGSASLPTAATFAPVAGGNSLSFSLQSGSLGGKVLTTSSTALKNIDVSLYRLSASRWSLIETVTSSSTGAYAFPYLEPGSYTVAFDSSRLQKSYASVYAGGRPVIGTTDGPAPDTALTSYYVTAGKATTVTQKIPTGGSITGTVRGGSAVRAGVGVRAMLLAGNPTDGFTGATIAKTAAATSASTGKFTLTGLSTGYYALSFDPTAAQDALFFDSYSDPVLGATDVQWIKVTAGKASAASTAATTLSSGVANAVVSGTLSGSPTSAAGSVSFTTLDGHRTRTAQISPSGTFSINLSNGRYRYKATPSNSSQLSTRYLATYGIVDAQAGQTTHLPPIAFTIEQPLAFAGTPTVDASTNSSGDVFTVTAATNHPTTARITYQWLRSGIPIFGARNATFQTGAADVGSQLSVRVNAVDLEGGESIASTVGAGTLVTLGAAPELLQRPSVTPSTNVTLGTVLHAVPGPTSPAATTFAYQWYEGGTPVDGATSASFTVRVGVNEVQVEVTPVLAGREAGLSDFSPSVAVSLKAAPVVKTAPKVTSKAVAGGITRYTITPGTWTPTTTSSFLWFADGDEAGSGATFDLAPGEYAGRAITVEASARRAGYAPGIRTLVVRKGLERPAQLIAPVINDTTTGAEINDENDAVNVGDVLVLTTGVWSAIDSRDAPVITYRWERFVGGSWTTAGTGTNYTVAAADVTRPLRLVTIATTRGYPVATETQDAGLGTAATGLELDGPAVEISGAAIGGETLTVARDGAWSLTGVTDTYSWFACTAGCLGAPTNFTAIAGATKASYLVPASLSGATVFGRITGSKPGYVSARVDSAPLAVTTETAITATVPPQIEGLNGDGAAAVGHALTAATGTYNLPGVNKTFAWEYCAQGCTIEDNWWRPDGYTTTFTPGTTAWFTGLGTLRLVETVSKTGYATQTFTSAVVDVVEGRAFEVYAPTFTKSGSKVTVAGSWEPMAGIQYQWLLNGAEVGNGQSSYTVAAADASKVLELRVVVAAPFAPYSEELEKTYVASAGTLPTLAPAAITGSATVGSTLTAPVPDVENLYDISPGYSYKWYSGTTAISGATSSTFVPTSAQRGKAVTVKVTVKAPSYITRTYTSVARTIGYGADLGGSVSVTTPAAFTPGAVLTATAVGYDPDDYTFSYRWQANGADIAGATKRTYTLTTTDSGKSVRAVISIARAGYSTVTKTSGAAPVGTAGPLVATTLPGFASVVDGAVKARATITVSAPKFAVAAALTYSWYRDGEVIRGATGSTFVTSPSDAGTAISARVVARATGFDATTLELAPVRITEGAAATATKKPVIAGTVKECSTLSASAGTWNVDGLRFSYQWMAGTTPIAGATAPTFLVADNSYSGAKLTVVVTATRAGIAAGVATSAATVAVGSTGC